LTIITLRNHADSSPLDEAIAAKIDPRLAVPAPTPIADLDPVVSDRVKGLLAAGQLGKLASRDFRCMPADWLPPDGYEGLLKPLGPLERVDLLQRRELGDDQVYLYDAVYATRTLRVDFALAPGDCISLLSIQPR
jgi:hypothetical protein